MKKSILITSVTILSVGILSELRASVTNNYDDDGRLIETLTSPQIQREGSTVYTIPGTKYTYNYDETTGKKTEMIKYVLRDNGNYERTDSYEYTYDTNTIREFRYGYCSDRGCNRNKFYMETQVIALDEQGNEKARQQYTTYNPSIAAPTSNLGDTANAGLEFTINEYYGESDGILNGSMKSSAQIHSYVQLFGNIPYTKYEYEYDSTTGLLKSKNSRYCSFNNDSTQPECLEGYYSTTTYEYDGYGNVVKEYIDGVLQTENNYSDTYYDNKCSEAKTCESCSSAGRVAWKGECYSELPFSKKHWTPAEAAQYLKDTDNEIIMTFKVNR